MLRQFVARHCVTFSVSPSLVRILSIDLYSIFILSTIHEILYIIKILLPGVLLIASMRVFAETSLFTAMDVEVPYTGAGSRFFLDRPDDRVVTGSIISK